MLNYASGPVVTALGLFGLVTSDVQGLHSLVYLFKPLASLGFLLTAAPALTSSEAPRQPIVKPSSKLAPLVDPTPPPSERTIFNRIIYGSLVLCLAGDVLLIPPWFTAGLAAFLLGHIGFSSAFCTQGLSPKRTLIAAAAHAVFGGVVWKWMGPHLPAADVVPVALYTTVICAMGTTAIGSEEPNKSRYWKQALGAVIFQLSDLFVARGQFVTKDIYNPVIGLPLYYLAVTLLAMLTWE